MHGRICTCDDAVDIVKECCGTQFDPSLVPAVVTLAEIGRFLEFYSSYDSVFASNKIVSVNNYQKF